MARPLVERRLIDVGDRLKTLRADIAVADEQLEHLAAEAEDTRLRSLVSETPLADRDHREAQRHADAMARHQAEVRSEIDRLERLQDDLLDRLSGADD